MATRKPAKKAAKKTTKVVAKKNARKTAKPATAAKRTYKRKPNLERAEELTASQSGLINGAHDDRVDALGSRLQEEVNVAGGVQPDGYSDSYVESLQRDVRHLNEQVEVLSDALTNPKDLGRRLQNIAPVVYLDLQQANEAGNAMGKAMVAHLLGATGFVMEGTEGMGLDKGPLKADSALGMIGIIKTEIVRLNTVNRTYSVHAESLIPEGTQLYRLGFKPFNPEINVAFGRVRQQVVVVDGVTYRRA